MPDYNNVQLMGRLTRDVQIRPTQYGSIGSFGLAVNRRGKGPNAKEETTFVDITVFAKLADVCAQYLRKGSPVFAAGHLKLEQWNDRTTGEKRSKLGVVAETVQFLDRPQGQSNGQYQAQNWQQQPNQNYPTPPPPPEQHKIQDQQPPAQPQVRESIMPAPDTNQPGWEKNQVGFRKAGGHTWGELANDVQLPDGTTGRDYLTKLSYWKDQPNIARVAQCALDLVDGQTATQPPDPGPPAMDEPGVDEPPF